MRTIELSKLIQKLIKQLESTGSVAGDVFFDSGMISRTGEEVEGPQVTKEKRLKKEKFEESPDPDIDSGYPIDESEAVVKTESISLAEDNDHVEADGNADVKDDWDEDEEPEQKDRLPVKRKRRSEKAVDYNEASEGLDYMVIQMQFTCEQCGKCYETKKKLRRHMELHKEVVTWHPCTICERPCKSKACRISHELSHCAKTDRPVAVCPVCGKTVTGCLKNHIRKAHGDKRTYVCEVCGKVLSSAGGIKTHMRIHSGETPFKCKICFKAFTTKSGHDIHMRAHNGIRPFTCKYCDKKFIDGSTLRVHYRQHTGESPYVCQYCGKTCKQAQNLRSHIRHIHTQVARIQTE